MPIYEYICKNCGYHLEELQGINDEQLRKCPQCHKLKLEKQISAPAFHLKGTGWYVTDFKDKKKDNPGDGNKAESNKAENTQSENSKPENTQTESSKTEDKPNTTKGGKKENAKKTSNKEE